MQQTVAAWENIDERTELGDVHNTTHVDSSDIGLWRVDDAQDTSLGFLNTEAIDRTDGHNADHAVVVDIDVGAGLLLDGVDDLALWPDDLADLVERHGDRDDLWCSLGNFAACFADAGIHVGEDCIAGLFGLSQRRDQHVGRDAVDLGVELQCGDCIRCTGHLEVHVAKGVFGSEDVGEGGVLAFGVDQAHGDTGYWSLDRNASFHQRQAARADRSHAG